MARAAKKAERDENFSTREMIEYENNFREPFSEIQNADKPRIEKIAFLGFLKKRREVPDLTFKKYLEDDPSIDQIQIDAFGEQEEEEAPEAE